MATKSKIPSVAMQKRIMKTGEVTDADVELYIKQVGMDTLQGMNLNPDNVKEYLKNITELGNKPKKKLPSKKKIDPSDAILVVDVNDRASKVSAEDAALTTQSRAKRATEGLIGLGSSAFNKMFPTLGKFMSYVQTGFENQNRKAKDTDTAVEGYSRQVGRSSVLLTNFIEGQERTNQILNQMLVAVGSRNMSTTQPNNVAGPENTNRSSQNQSGSNEQARQARNAPNDAGVAAAAAAFAATGATAAVGLGTAALLNRQTPTTNSSASTTAATPPIPTASSVTINPLALTATTPAVVAVVPTPSTTPAASVVSNPVAAATRSTAASINAPSLTPRAGSNSSNEPDIKLLNFKAREIIFKADKFEYPQAAISAVGGVSAGGATSSGGGMSTTPSPSPSGAAGAASTGLPELTSIRTKSGKSVQVATAVANKFQGFLNDLEDTGYRIREIGGYANRPNVNNPSVMSTHASGLAIDINPAQNPNRSTTTDMPPETAQIAAKWGLGWGMNWRSVKDPMHFSAAPNEGASAPQPAVATAVASGGISSGGADATHVHAGGQQRTAATPAPMMPIASPVPSTPSSGATMARASTADEASTRPSSVSVTAPQNSPTAPISNAAQQPSSTSIDPNNPGEVEPPDAAQRYARLFSMAA